MVDLTRHPDPAKPDDPPRVQARLLDLVPGRSGTVYAAWLRERGEDFRAGVRVATLDPFHGYKNAIDDQLDQATAVLDAFHVVKLGGQALDEVRRRVQQAIHGHRGRKGDPLYGIRNILRLGLEHLSDKQQARIMAAFAADERHVRIVLHEHVLHAKVAKRVEHELRCARVEVAEGRRRTDVVGRRCGRSRRRRCGWGRCRLGVIRPGVLLLGLFGLLVLVVLRGSCGLRSGGVEQPGGGGESQA